MRGTTFLLLLGGVLFLAACQGGTASVAEPVPAEPAAPPVRRVVRPREKPFLLDEGEPAAPEQLHVAGTGAVR